MRIVHSVCSSLMFVTLSACSGCECTGDAIVGSWQATEVTLDGETQTYPWSDEAGDGDYHYGELWLSLTTTDGEWFTYREYMGPGDSAECEVGYDDLLDRHAVTVSAHTSTKDCGPFEATLEIADLGLTLICSGDDAELSCESADGSASAHFESDSYSASTESLRGGEDCP